MRRTLVGRVVAAVLLAFVLVGAALVAVDYLGFKRAMASNSGLQQVGRAMAETLATIEEPHDAAVAVASAAATLNTERREASTPERQLDPVLHQLRDARGAVIWSDARLGARELAGEVGTVVERTVDGRRYWVVQADSPRWSLRLGEPIVDDVTVLGWLARDLLPSLLIALPLVLLPVWLAVRRGLAPLRRLGARLEARGADDLAPLDADLKYAELTSVATAFNRLLDRLRDKVRREHAFVQDAAHELRTPMAVISAQAHVLTRAATAAERSRAEGELDHAIARASHLAQQLLALAALDDARHAAPAPTDVAELTRRLIGPLVPAAVAAGIELELDSPDRLPWRLDPPAFQSIVQNLLDNALRYVPAGGRVLLTLAADASLLTLTVADDGPGIAPADQPRIFERFVRGSGQQVAGSGLGLAIVRQAALAMGGEARLGAGLDGRGAGFVVTLPGAAAS